MRTTENLTVSLPPQQLREMRKTAKKENRTISDLIREAFRRYKIEEAQRQLLADPLRPQRLAALKRAVDELRKEAATSGVAKMSARQINSIVEASRRDRAARTKKSRTR